MHSPEDFDNLTILLGLSVSACVLATVLIFLLWLRRERKRKSRNATKRVKGVRPIAKKRPK